MDVRTACTQCVLALVRGVQQDVVRLVLEGHQQHRADTRLDILLRGVELRAADDRLEGIHHTGIYFGNGNYVVFDAEVARQLLGVLHRLEGREGRGHQQRADILRPQRIGGDRGHHGRVDAARKADRSLPVAVLAEEIPQSAARIIEEKTMGKSRADVVMVLEEELVGIEIKSDADTYARLSRQVKDYDRFFDRNYVVAGSKHAHHVGEHVPEWWGIITVEEVDGVCDFYVLRKAEKNPKQKMLHKIKLLWRPELAHIQEVNHLPAYKQKSKDFVRKKIMEKVPEDLLHKQISDELFERDYTTIQQQIDEFKKR